MDRRKEAEPDSEDYNRADIQVEKGELVGQGEGQLTVGCLDNLIIISNGNPKELWASLMAPSSGKLADLPIHQKMVSEGGGAPEISAMANLAVLLRASETGLKSAVDEAQAKVGAGAQSQEGQFDMGALQLQVAQAAYNAYMTFKKLFSLDKLGWVGAGAHFAVSDDRAVSSSFALLSHGQPISPLLSEVLNGSGRFQPPAVGKPDCMTLMARVDVGHIINEVVNSVSTMGGPIGMSLQTQLQMAKLQWGVGLDDLLGILAPDFYVYVDIVEKDVEESSWKVPTRPPSSGRRPRRRRTRCCRTWASSGA